MKICASIIGATVSYELTDANVAEITGKPIDRLCEQDEDVAVLRFEEAVERLTVHKPIALKDNLVLEAVCAAHRTKEMRSS